VIVICTKGGSASDSFTVGAASISPAQVSVIKSGFSTEAFGSQTWLHCGIELHNSSLVSDARSVAVTVTFVDTLGRSLTTSEIELTVIPAGETFYASCLTIVNVTLSVAAAQAHVKIGKSVAKKAQLPSVSGLKLESDDFGDTQTLIGSLTNAYSQPMPQDAAIYAVYYDAAGDIIGGDWTPTGASVQPGATVGFSFPDLPMSVASAEVSIDPCGLASIVGACAVP
jgi:hypothetical protein